MARRELSSTLRNLKFMQRAGLPEEEPKKEEEVKPDGNFSSPGPASRKCVVIIEGNPHPGAIKGRMSFQSFNPSIDKLNEEAASPHQPATSTASFGNLNVKMSSSRENGSSRDEAEYSDSNEQNCTINGGLKRKQSDVVSGQTQPTDTFPGNLQDNESSLHNTKKGSFKKPKRERLDWNVLRPPKNLSKRN